MSISSKPLRLPRAAVVLGFPASPWWNPLLCPDQGMPPLARVVYRNYSSISFQIPRSSFRGSGFRGPATECATAGPTGIV